MAAPIFNDTGYMTLVADADTVQWPPSTEVDPDIKVQGGGSNLDAIRNGGTFTFTFGTSQDMSAANTMPRVWFMHTFPSYLQTTALGGLQIGLTSGGTTGYWYVSGSDKHKGSWELLQCDPSATVDAGTAPTLSAIDEMEIVMVHATSARNLDNTFIDISYYGIGLEFYSGASGDKVTWNTLAQADTGSTTSKQYGIIEWILNGAYYLSHAVHIGDSIGTNDTYFDGTNETIVFYSANEKTGSYQIKATGNATGTTDIDLTGSTILSASSPFILDMSSANLTTLTMSGTSVKNASSSLFKTGQTITSTTFSECGPVEPNGASLNSCSFNNHTSTGVITSSLANLVTCSFLSSGTGYGVDLGVQTTNTQSWDGTSSGYTDTTGNTTIKVEVNGTDLLTINNDSGDTIFYENVGTSTAGANGDGVVIVTGQRTMTFDISPTPTDYEYRIYTVTASGSLTGAVEVQGLESTTSSSQAYTYSYSAGVIVAFQVLDHSGIYKESLTYYSLPDANTTQNITLEEDTND